MYYIDAADDSNARTAECMRKMYAMQQNKGILCDVTLKVSEREFKVHRVVLASACPYFNTMFTGHMREADLKEIELINIDPETFEHLLRLFYTQRIEIDDNNILDLFRASHYYLLDDLKKDCISYLNHWLTKDNFLGVCRLAMEFSCDKVVHGCCLFMINNLSLITDSVIQEFFEELFLLSLTIGYQSCDEYNKRFLEQLLYWMRSNESHQVLIKTTIESIIIDIESNPQDEILASLASNELWKVLLKEVAEKQPRDSTQTTKDISSSETKTVEEPKKCIQVMHKLKIKKNDYVVGLAWFQNKIYICCRSRRIYVVPDQPPFSETMAEIDINKAVDPTDMVLCKTNQYICVCDSLRNSLVKIQLSDYSDQVRFNLPDMPLRMSITPSAELLIVVMRPSKSSKKWYIRLLDNENKMTDCASSMKNVHSIEHAVKVPCGNLIILYEVKNAEAFRSLLAEMSVPEQTLLWKIDIQTTALPPLRQFFSSQIFVREDGEILVAGLTKCNSSYRNHVFLLTRVDSDLHPLLHTFQKYDCPIRLSCGRDDQQLVICRMEEAEFFICISRISG